MKNKENKFDPTEFTEKMENAFKQFEEFEKLIPFLKKNLNLLDKKITPIYKTAKKLQKTLDKFFFAMKVVSKSSMINLFIKKIGKERKKDFDLTI